MTATLSIIIPCFRDEDALEGLLERLGSLSAGPLEVIVVDGAGSARCAEIAKDHGARYLSDLSHRGARLAAGAGAATAPILWFLHADALVPDAALPAMRAAVDAGAIGGFFRFAFAGPSSLTKEFLAAMVNWRCRFGIPYGDQGLFMTADAYEKAGGHAPLPLFEEVTLVRNARRIGAFRRLSVAMPVNARRWERDGYWRRTLINRLMAFGFTLGISAERLARWYR